MMAITKSSLSNSIAYQGNCELDMITDTGAACHDGEGRFEVPSWRAKMDSGVYQFLVGCVAALGSFLFSYEIDVIAEVMASDPF